MGTTENELRREAQQDRERMGQTLEAIGDRISPERIVERRKAAAGQSLRHMREAVMGSPDFVEAGSRAREQVGAAAASTLDTASSVAQSVQHAPGAVAQHAVGNPLAAGLVAFGAGLLVATAFPGTRTEQHLLDSAQPLLEDAKAELREVGQELGGGLRENASHALEATAAAGRDAASAVAGEAQASARTITDEAKDGSSS